MIQISNDLLPELARKHYEAIDDFFNRSSNKVNKYESPRMDALKDLLGGVDGIKKTILAKPNELKEIADRIGERNVLGNDDLAIFVRFYKSFISPTKTNDSWDYNYSKAIKRLGIQVCPYCNSNYVYHFDKSTSEKRTFEIDHFYPKSKYPYLAISFYNLIPSCKDCNKAKDSDLIRINPYDLENDLGRSFKFGYQIKKANLNRTDPEVVALTFDHKGDSAAFDQHDRVLGLTDRHDHRRDLILEAIHKKQMYSDEYLDMLYENYKGTIFTSKEDVLRYVSGNYVTDDGFLKRPFSKLNKDIWEQLDE